MLLPHLVPASHMAGGPCFMRDRVSPHRGFKNRPTCSCFQNIRWNKIQMDLWQSTRWIFGKISWWTTTNADFNKEEGAIAGKNGGSLLYWPEPIRFSFPQCWWISNGFRCDFCSFAYSWISGQIICQIFFGAKGDRPIVCFFRVWLWILQDGKVSIIIPILRLKRLWFKWFSHQMTSSALSLWICVLGIHNLFFLLSLQLVLCA